MKAIDKHLHIDFDKAYGYVQENGRGEYNLMGLELELSGRDACHKTP